MIVSRLNQSIHTLPSLGSHRVRLFHRMGVKTVGDLLQFYPRAYEDRSKTLSLVEAAQEHAAAVRVTVVGHEFFYPRTGKTLKIIVSDDTSRASLVCFGRNFLEKSFVPGREFYIWGQFRLRFGEISASVFEAEPVANSPGFGVIQPVYQLTEGLGQTIVRRAVQAALEQYNRGLSDEIPEEIRRAGDLMGKSEALTAIHRPPDLAALERAKARLVFEELFLFQMQLIRLAAGRKAHVKRTIPPDARNLGTLFRTKLPFTPTESQEAVFAEIRADMERPTQMIRLLQGDVGSGKTLVAILAALESLGRGQQVAFMAPTELLARQHAKTLSTLLAGLPVRLGLATGKMNAAQRKHLFGSVRTGETDLVIGTHALFSADLAYHDLGLAIIDEQHRFGVDQRALLEAKGLNPDILLMSATPIPRTLALTAFGGTDISTIRGLPPGRTPVETHLTRHGSEENVYRAVERELAAGRQAYFVYPRISAEGAGNLKNNLKNVEEMFSVLRHRFPTTTIAIVHSRIDDDERDRRMSAFRTGEVQILVATTVVEVGVDVPNATCMVVDHAEYYGLSALHQLRGRVGRGENRSYCFLIYDPDLTETAKERLQVLYREHDGFVVAEEDLRIRGPGDLSGLRQSGFMRFRIADLHEHMGVMQETRRIARSIVEIDETLKDALDAMESTDADNEG